MDKIKKYLIYAKPYYKYYVIILYLIVLGSVISLVYSIVIKVVIDNVLIKQEYYLLGTIALMLVISQLISTIINYSNGMFNTFINQKISITIKQKLVDYIQKIKLNDINIINTGDLTSRTKNDINTITQFLTTSIITIITNISNLIVYFFVMFYIDKKLTLIALFFGIIQLYISKKFSSKIKTNRLNLRKKDAEHLSYLTHLFTNLKFYKSFNKIKYNNSKYIKLLKNIKVLKFKEFFIRYLYGTSISYISFLGSITILGLGIYEISQGKMSVGTLFVFDGLTEKFYQYANSMVDFNIEFQNACVSIERIDTVFQLKMEDYDEPSIQPSIQYTESESNAETNLQENYIQCKEDNRGLISISNMSFNYGKKTILNDISLVLNSKKTYIIVGPSGQGKTTIASLLTKFQEPIKGNIRYHNMDIKTLSVNKLRERITYIIQESVILNDTIRENLLLGNENVDAEKFSRVCKICHIEDFVNNLKDRYETLIGEKGIQLSEGEKQRISIARGLFRNSEIYIFDEITSNLDKRLAIDIIRGIQMELSNKIKIYITHDISLLADKGEIIILNNAEIEDIGLHETLLKKNKFYQHIYLKGDKQIV
ncbi:multidrug ABC transporter ATPase [Vallitalea longa]|uniref:Multidrug ABC transporter ATPase n=1 Tax=Vallitalea longa TaxID=2936439 RepID=A0A9W5YH34_9FIRM|nr:ABC transporter ATP-binding protein [Vallitalea longa]GKX32168.1 multidrug ABC transporter ATPase [Vallitalea longa]